MAIGNGAKRFIGLQSAWLLLRTIHAKQLAGKFRSPFERLVDTLRLTSKIRVERADYDSGVQRLFTVQADKVFRLMVRTAR